ncbi:putative sporulation protein YtxC [Pradoshia eiseniae]|uniref:putative sporulation protein YtxC n=1 Tax=Pradoshia eiseniae TaxID=2064768 RepID=UPI001F31F8FF|nr:putative sporulation protein YtxC [Pradoshia eiseniae]
MHFDSREEQACWHVRMQNSHPIIQQAVCPAENDGQKFISFRLEPNRDQAACLALIEFLYSFFSSYHLEKKIREIIQNRYLFQDEDEVEHIAEMAMLMWEGEVVYHGANDLPEKLRNRVSGLFKEIVSEQVPFSFQSLWSFRMRAIQDEFVSLVGIAIDEYKLEQDYQEFIFLLRGLLEVRRPLLEEVHLVYKDEFFFYNQHFQLISKRNLANAIDRKLMAENPMFVDSNTIAPLVSMAPRKIFIYAEDEEIRIIRTLKKIFEERIIIAHPNHFADRLNGGETR